MPAQTFQTFLDNYEPAGAVGCSPARLPSLFPCRSAGLTELSGPYAGATFNDGLYRLHTADAIPMFNDLAWQSFPEFRERVYCFGYDWLGRQFALDVQRREGDDCLVLMLEPGAGRAMEIPATFTSFHNEEIVEYSAEALASGFFEEWSAESGITLEPSQCVGFKVPLFLGGEDTLDNMELSDLEVYWSICAQLMEQVRNPPPGTRIDSVALSRD